MGWGMGDKYIHSLETVLESLVIGVCLRLLSWI